MGFVKELPIIGPVASFFSGGANVKKTQENAAKCAETREDLFDQIEGALDPDRPDASPDGAAAAAEEHEQQVRRTGQTATEAVEDAARSGFTSLKPQMPGMGKIVRPTTPKAVVTPATPHRGPPVKKDAPGIPKNGDVLKKMPDAPCPK